MAFREVTVLEVLRLSRAARYLAAVGEATEVPPRSPGRGPPCWKSRVLRRQALSDEDDGQGRWVRETA
jgi:hypothetical protein